jgi:hypothetical protein
VFANQLVVLLPAGIGISLRVRANERAPRRCSYPVRTREPTGVVEVERGASVTVGQLFAVWGQPLSQTRLVGFRTGRERRVLAFVNGTLWPGDARDIPLHRHDEIVLEIGGFIRPHTSYLFPKGL